MQWFKRRELFRFWDGSRKRAIDPITPWSSLLASETLDKDYEFLFSDAPDISDGADEQQLELIAMDTQNRIEATHRIAECVREAFGVQSWNEETGKGLTVNETLELLASYYEYAHLLKKNTEPSLTSPVLTESSESLPTPKKKHSIYFGDASRGKETTDSSSPLQQPSAVG